MPVKTVYRGGKWRVIEAATGRIAKTPKGTPRDGGGHENRVRAEAQAGHINKGTKS